MEIKKLTQNKKYILFVVIFIFAGILGFCKYDGKYGYEDYYQSYHADIDKIIKSSNELNTYSIFTQKDSFSERNIQQTKSDFEQIANINIVEFDNEFLCAYFDFPWLNIILISYAILGAFVFSEKKSRGMQAIIHSSISGRQKFVMRRLFAIFLFDFCCILLFQGVLFILCAMKYGGDMGNSLGYPIQSIPLFKMLTIRMTIAEFIIIDFIYKLIKCLVLSICIWTAFMMIDNVLLSLAIMTAAGLAEYALYVFILPGYKMELLHYCNIFYIFSKNLFWTEYKNLNIFSYPLNSKLVIIILLFLLILSICAVVFVYGKKSYPVKERNKFLDSLMKIILQKWYGIVALVQENMGCIGSEFYKIIIIQKGLLLLIATVLTLLVLNPVSNIKFTGCQKEYNKFIREFGSAPNDKSNKAIQALEKELDSENSKYEAVMEDYEKGLKTEEEMYEAEMIHDALAYKREFFQKIQEQTNYLNELNEKKGINGWYVNSFEFLKLFENERIINVVIILLFVTLISEASMLEEKKSGMIKNIHCTYYGRKNMFNQKFFVSAVLSILVYIVMITIRFINVKRAYGVEGLSAPAQSFYELSGLNINCSLLTYLLCFYGVRIIAIICLSIVITTLSCRFDSRFFTMIIFSAEMMLYIIVKNVVSFDIPIWAFILGITFTIIFTVAIAKIEQKKWMDNYAT